MTYLDNIKSTVSSLISVASNQKKGYARLLIPSGVSVTLVGTSPEISISADANTDVLHVKSDGAEIGTVEEPDVQWASPVSTIIGDELTRNSPGQSVWDVFISSEAIIVGNMACVTLDSVSFPPDGIVYSFVNENGSSQVVLIDETPDIVEAIYIETNNTILGGMQSVIKDRPIILDTLGNKLRALLEWRDNTAVTLTEQDIRSINVLNNDNLPSRGIVFSADVLPVDIGGDTFGTAAISVVADTLYERYGSKKAVISLGRKTNVLMNKLTGVRMGDIIQINTGGDIIKVLVTEKEIRISSPGQIQERIGGVVVD